MLEIPKTSRAKNLSPEMVVLPAQQSRAISMNALYGSLENHHSVFVCVVFPFALRNAFKRIENLTNRGEYLLDSLVSVTLFCRRSIKRIALITDRRDFIVTL